MLLLSMRSFSNLPFLDSASLQLLVAWHCSLQRLLLRLIVPSVKFSCWWWRRFLWPFLIFSFSWVPYNTPTCVVMFSFRVGHALHDCYLMWGFVQFFCYYGIPTPPSLLFGLGLSIQPYPLIEICLPFSRWVSFTRTIVIFPVFMAVSRFLILAAKVVTELHPV